MSIVVSFALLLSFLGYFFIGYLISRKTRNVGDLLPISKGQHQAEVRSTAEFSSSTVAATISLTTVILAFFELAPYYGYWLFWCVLTTSLGIYVVKLFARRIWRKLNNYEVSLSLHSFLSKEYSSDKISIIGASATSLGFLGAFAVELTVGSRFLSSLMPEVPQYIAVLILSLVAFVYTALGGFRAVVVTDRIQMIAIWVFLLVLVSYFLYFTFSHGGFSIQYAKIPSEVKELTWREGLVSFMIGIFIINVPTYVADMSIWQRIAATKEPKTIYKGLGLSVVTSGITWSLIVSLACSVFIFGPSEPGNNSLFSFMNYLGTRGTLEKAVLFVSVVGLFAAMLSTASTQLIVTAHSLYEDIISKVRKLTVKERLQHRSELKISRFVLIIAALISVSIVEVLNYFKFTISDLIFAIYGSQLGLFAPVLLALFMERDRLRPLKLWAIASIVLGFVSGWSAAIYGKITDNADLVFLSPCISLFLSLSVLLFGFIKNRIK